MSTDGDEKRSCKCEVNVIKLTYNAVKLFRKFIGANGEAHQTFGRTPRLSSEDGGIKCRE